MITLIPPMGILIDIPLGILMWTMVGQFVLGIFLRDDSRLALLRIIRGLNTPVLFLTGLIQPAFINDRLAPLFAALVLFIARYYLFPLIIGFDVESFSQMPLEKLLLSAKAVEVDETDNTIAVEVITANNFLFIALHFFKYLCT